MGEGWMPEQVYWKDTLYENIMLNASGIQFVHRNLALLVFVLMCVLWYRSNKLQLNSRQNLGVTLVIYGVTIQFILGVLTLLYQVPVLMGAAHQTGAFFLFGASVFLIYHLFNNQTQAGE